MFKSKTILLAVGETGLYPYKPSRVSDKLQAREEAMGQEENLWVDINNFEDPDASPAWPATPPTQTITSELGLTPQTSRMINRTFDSVLATPLLPSAQHAIEKLRKTCVTKTSSETLLAHELACTKAAEVA